MTSINSAIVICGFLMCFSFGILMILAGGSSASIGCYVIGSEINGDNSIEYLAIGNC